jgi:poly-gamma-glutamate capsule biosynthesis protein CapA/YwtB (metallophosphatase superfamily)
MADQEFERDEQLIEARRLRRMELRRKRRIRQRITWAIVLAVLVLIIVLIVKSCGKSAAPASSASGKTTETQTTATEAAASQTPQKATLSAVGDIMVYDDQLKDAKQTDGSYNFLPALAPVSPLLTASDLTVGNFEANFAGEPYSGKPSFSAPDSLATTLAGLGFDVLQTANTYSIQNGLVGLSRTVNTIRKEGMNALGTFVSASDKTANEVAVREVNGVKIAFIGFTKGVNNINLPTGASYAVNLLYKDYATNYKNVDSDGIKAVIDAAKATSPDVIVAMVHWGSEYELEPSDTQKSIADLMFQNGVDVILGTHSHVVGPMEKRTVTVDGKSKDVFVAYSLGNFMSSMSADYTREGAVLNLEFTKDASGTTISKIDYVPTLFTDNGANEADRFEVQNVYTALASQPSADAQKTLEQAVKDLADHTGSSFARSADSASGETTAASGETTSSDTTAASSQTTADTTAASGQTTTDTTTSGAAG